MFYRTDEERKGVVPLSEEELYIVLNDVKAVELRMCRAEDRAFLRTVFTYFGDPTNQQKKPSGFRILDLLAFTKEEILQMNIPGITAKAIDKRMAEFQKFYGVSVLPRRNPNNPLDIYFFGDQLDAIMDKKLVASRLALPEAFGDNNISYVDYLKSGEGREGFIKRDIQIGITGGLTRLGMRLFVDSFDSEKGKAFWAGFKPSDDPEVTRKNVLQLAALPSNLDAIGATKLGMIHYTQTNLLGEETVNLE